MQSAGLVAIALLGGVLLTVILGGMSVLGFFMWKAKGTAEAHAKELRDALERQQAFIAAWMEEATEILATSSKRSETVYAEMKGAVESLKSSLTGARTETKNTNNVFIAKLETLLKTQHDELKAITASINGETLQAASARATVACLKMEKLLSSLHAMLMTHNEREESPAGLGAEEYAPDGDSTIYSQTNVGRQDDLDFKEAVAELEATLADR